MIVTVTQLNNYLKGVVDTDGILSNVSVQGEVTNLKNAHNCIFFSLKDDCSQIDCFAYQNDIAELSFGNVVVCSGTVNYLPKYGKISFFVKKVALSNKLGDKYQALLELQQKLEKEGIFDVEHKLPVPVGERQIGVISSQSGAVIKDICDVVWRRQPYSDVVLYPVHVQGESAEGDILKAIEYFQKTDIKVIILARGGGSNEDLSVFNSEKIVRAIYNSKVAFVSAIGHGVDFTLCDFVADRRAVTPTEAGEFVTFDCRHFKEMILSELKKQNLSLKGKYGACRNSVVNAVSKSFFHFNGKIDKTKEFVKSKLGVFSLKLENELTKKELLCQRFTEKIEANNPINLLKRGYSKVSSEKGKIVSVDDVGVGEKINVHLCDGVLVAKVQEVKK